MGSGWLGLPLIQRFIDKGFDVKASTQSVEKLSHLSSLKATPFIVDIDHLTDNIQAFLKSPILLINITSKKINGFQTLLAEIEKSEIEKVLFVSSTSVYDSLNQTIDESMGFESESKPLSQIEALFTTSQQIETTVVRFAGLIGYNRHPGRFFASGKILKDPDGYVNLIHRDDCIAILTQLIEQDIWGEAFNCCADSHPKKCDYYTKAAKSISVDIPRFASPGSTTFKIISNKKIKQRLNYSFLHADLMDINYLK